jgi:hypothetical protein
MGRISKKLMNNAVYFLDELTVIIKEGIRLDTILSNANVDALCQHFREVLFL